MAERRYQEAHSRSQVMLLPPCLDDYVSENNAVRAIDAFVGTLDCYSAWVFDADRHGNPLMSSDSAGSNLRAEQHSKGPAPSCASCRPTAPTSTRSR